MTKYSMQSYIISVYFLCSLQESKFIPHTTTNHVRVLSHFSSKEESKFILHPTNYLNDRENGAKAGVTLMTPLRTYQRNDLDLPKFYGLEVILPMPKNSTCYHKFWKDRKYIPLNFKHSRVSSIVITKKVSDVCTQGPTSRCVILSTKPSIHTFIN